MSKTIYAVLTGINAYQNNPLYGCLNDVLSVKDFLEKLVANNDAFDVLDLQLLIAPHTSQNGQSTVDETELSGRGIKKEDYLAPTRNNIIQSFQHFTKAHPDKEDICLFYYCGHGSVQEAPVQFQHLKSDNQIESLVCLDSRNDEGYDLIDKELAYLIWETTNTINARSQHEKDIHFLVITDCCHAGDITRAVDNYTRRREDIPNENLSVLENYYGYPDENFYQFNENENRIDIKHGRHIQLSASRDNESANETLIDHKRRGIFTHCLLQTLQNNYQLTYNNLIAQLKMAVKLRVGSQIPGVQVQSPDDIYLPFLGSDLTIPQTAYVVYYSAGEWKLNAGLISGIIPPSPDTGVTSVKLQDDRVINVIKVFPTESVLDPTAFKPEESDRDDYTLNAVIHKIAVSKTQVYIDEINRKTLEQAEYSPRFFEFIAASKNARYEVLKSETGWVLKRSGVQQAVFEREKNVGIFMSYLDKIGRWHALLDMDTSHSNISNDAFQIEIDVIENKELPQNLNGISSGNEPLINPDKISLNYVNNLQPAFRCKIQSTENYFVRALYFDAEFGIAKMLEKELRPGNGEWLHFKEGDQLYDTVPIQFSRIYHKRNQTRKLDYIKFFISRNPFGDIFKEQYPIPLEKKQTRGMGREITPPQHSYDDWLAITIPVKVGRDIAVLSP